MKILDRVVPTNAPAATILIRILVGAVFLSEGIQKYINPDAVGAGRFAKIGFENGTLLAPFVGATEICCGAFVLVGLLTRLAVVPLIIIMLTAIATTKIPILIGRDFLGFHVRQMSEYGFWSMAHESRTDFAMLLGALFLLCVGAGRVSVDHCWQCARRGIARR